MRHTTAPGSAPRRSGKVVVLFAMLLPVIFAMVAIGAEGGLMLDHRRGLQAATDSAAMAPAVDLYRNYLKNNGSDPNGTAVQAAKAAASAYGFTTNATDTTVTVSIPPATGPSKGLPGYVEVVIKYKQRRYFSRLLGSEPVELQARTVGRGRSAAYRIGILVLDLFQAESLKANGGGTVSVTNCDIIVNSKDASAVGGDGTNTILKTVNGSFVLTGGIKNGTILQGPVLFNQPPTPDPLAYLPEPTMPATAFNPQTMKVNPNSGAAAPYLTALGIDKRNVTQMFILEPGRYDQMPNFTNGDVVILKQASANANKGIYYLNGSGFTSTGATVAQDPTGGTTGGLMLYNAPKAVNGGSDAIKITGGRVVLSPLTTTAYKGIAIFQKRSSDIPIAMNGQGGFLVTGTFYNAGGALSISGSNSVSADVIGSQYISRTLESGGNGQYRVDWGADNTSRIRQVGIVE